MPMFLWNMLPPSSRLRCVGSGTDVVIRARYDYSWHYTQKKGKYLNDHHHEIIETYISISITSQSEIKARRFENYLYSYQWLTSIHNKILCLVKKQFQSSEFDSIISPFKLNSELSKSVSISFIRYRCEEIPTSVRQFSQFVLRIFPSIIFLSHSS
jgi:hypothetical protein